MVFSLFKKKVQPVQESPGNEPVAIMDPRVRAAVHSIQERAEGILRAPQVEDLGVEAAQAPKEVPVPDALQNIEGPKEVVASQKTTNQAQRGRYIGSTTATLRTKNTGLDQILSSETHQAMTQFGGKNATNSAKGLTQFYLENDFDYHEHPTPKPVIQAQDPVEQSLPSNLGSAAA